MKLGHKNIFGGLVLSLSYLFFSCGQTHSGKGRERIANAYQMDIAATDSIKTMLQEALKNNGKINDTSFLIFADALNNYYQSHSYQLIFSHNEKWQPLADSLFKYLSTARQYGLFENDYQFKNLESLKKILPADSIKKMDAGLWALSDLMFADAFIHIAKDLKMGRLQLDNTTKDTSFNNNFFAKNINQAIQDKTLSKLFISLQPTHKGYWELIKGINFFLDSMDKQVYTFINYPYKKNNANDSILFIKILQKRLYESKALSFTNKMPSAADISGAIIKLQKQKGVKPDGKISASFIKLLNTNDTERFKQIAITLDRYKQLPHTLPLKYIWINLPAFNLRLIDSDTIVLESKIICGKPDTKTPLLSSAINEMITYPTWTVPTSIIAKSYLPKLKRNANYLSKIGIKLLNAKGQIINGNSVNWSKYSKGIPFKVMQNSGDNNALGIFKFNFNNPYSVYLHDTNQRYLFNNTYRALSHGCVRVQEWQELAFYIARNDSILARSTDTLKYNVDSIKNWIAHKEHHRIEVKNKLPLYIKYFTCEGKDGKIKFYDDIYGDDKTLSEKYFANK